MVAELSFHYNKSQFLPGENIKEFTGGHDILKILVAETILGTNDELSRSNQSLDYEISPRLEHKMEEHIQKFDKEDDNSYQEKTKSAVVYLCGVKTSMSSGEEKRTMVAVEEVMRTEIRTMVEQSITFLNILFVDDKFRDNKSISKQQQEATEVDKSIRSSKIPTLPSSFAYHIPMPSENNFPVILKYLMLIIASIRQISTNDKHVSLKYWFSGTCCHWKKLLGKS